MSCREVLFGPKVAFGVSSGLEFLHNQKVNYKSIQKIFTVVNTM